MAAITSLWDSFIEKNENDPRRMRAVMFLILLVITCTEIGLASQGYVDWWVLAVSLLANFWGGLDALLRYPAAHYVESFFCVKQFALIAAKTIAFFIGIGMVSPKQNVALFFGALVLDIWWLPILYVMALPLNRLEQVVEDDACDVDVALRLWRLASSPVERRVCMAHCQGWWYRKLTKASELSTLARRAICATSADHRRVLRAGRCV